MRTIACDFGTFVIFLIFAFVILFFPKHRYFREFRCNSQRNDSNQQSKTSEDL